MLIELQEAVGLNKKNRKHLSLIDLLIYISANYRLLCIWLYSFLNSFLLLELLLRSIVDWRVRYSPKSTNHGASSKVQYRAANHQINPFGLWKIPRIGCPADLSTEGNILRRGEIASKTGLETLWIPHVYSGAPGWAQFSIVAATKICAGLRGREERPIDRRNNCDGDERSRQTADYSGCSGSGQCSRSTTGIVRIWYDTTRSVSLVQLSELARLEETLCLDSRRQSMGRWACQDGAADLSDRLGVGWVHEYASSLSRGSWRVRGTDAWQNARGTRSEDDAISDTISCEGWIQKPHAGGRQGLERFCKTSVILGWSCKYKPGSSSPRRHEPRTVHWRIVWFGASGIASTRRPREFQPGGSPSTGSKYGTQNSQDEKSETAKSRSVGAREAGGDSTLTAETVRWLPRLNRYGGSWRDSRCTMTRGWAKWWRLRTTWRSRLMSRVRGMMRWDCRCRCRNHARTIWLLKWWPRCRT